MTPSSSSLHVSVIDRTRVPLKLGFVKFFVAFLDKSEEWITVAGVKMERQCHTRWCWASVAEAVARCYDPTTDCTQKAIAKMLHPEYSYDAPCYTDPTQDENLPYNTDEVLMSVFIRMNCLGGVNSIPYVPDPPEGVQKWIDGDQAGRRLVCVRIVWPNGNGHFVVIDGYRRGTNLLSVWDPLEGSPKEITYDDLAKHYPSWDGKWTDTIYTTRSVKKCGNG